MLGFGFEVDRLWSSWAKRFTGFGVHRLQVSLEFRGSSGTFVDFGETMGTKIAETQQKQDIKQWDCVSLGALAEATTLRVQGPK